MIERIRTFWQSLDENERRQIRDMLRFLAIVVVFVAMTAIVMGVVTNII